MGNETSAESKVPARTNKQLRNVVLASLVGGAVEWYDFVLFGASAALVFDRVFFPEFDPAVGLLLSLLTYATGYLARPFGGMLFGHFGDKIGRKPVLIVSFVLMGVSTAFMGLLPTYAMIGLAAPILLVLLRLLQGIAVGGEFGGAALLASETAPPNRRGLFASSAIVGQSVGILMGTAVFTAFSYLPADDFLIWGWRVPFLLSLVLVVLGWWVRRKVEETHDFKMIREGPRRKGTPLAQALREHPAKILLILGTRIGQTTQYNIASVFALSYGVKQLHIPQDRLLTATTIASFVSILIIPLGGLVSDILGRRVVALFGALAAIGAAFAFFPLLQTGEPIFAIFAIVMILGVTTGLNNSVPAAYFPELFPPHLRYSGVSVPYQLGTVTGGFTPAICTVLALEYGIGAVAAYMIGAGALIFVCFLGLPETHRPAAKVVLSPEGAPRSPIARRR
jgi:MHS family shikimate/dehydroshikimate transporter-like MFS transporter